MSVNGATATDYTNAALASTNVGDEVELVVDGTYYTMYKVITGFNNYAVITTGTTEFGDTRVKVLKADGTETIAVVDDKIGGTTLPSAGIANGELMTYNLKSDNSKVDVDETDVVTLASGSSFKSKAMTIGSNVVASDAVVFLYSTTDAKWKVYTANQLSDFTTSAAGGYIVENSKIVALSATVANFPTAGSVSRGIGYVTNRVIADVNGDKVTQLTIWDGSNSITLNVDSLAATAYAGDFVEFPVVADGALVDDSSIYVEGGIGSSLTGAVIKVKSFENGRIVSTTDTINSSGTVVAGTDTAYVVDSDTKYIGVKTGDKAGSTNNSVVAYTKAYGDDFANAYVLYEVVNGVNEVKAVFIDESGKMTEYTGGGSATTGGTHADRVAAAQDKVDAAVTTLQGKGTSEQAGKYYSVKSVTGTDVLTGLSTDGVSYTVSAIDIATAKIETGYDGLSYTDDSANVGAVSATAGKVTITNAMDSVGDGCMLKIVVSDIAGIATAKTVYVLAQYDA